MLHTKLKKKKSKALASWEVPQREWEPKTRIWYLNYSLFFLLIMMLAAVLEAYVFIALVLAFAGLWFLQAAIKPANHKVSITTIGVRAYERMFQWEHVRYFWVSQKGDTFFLHLDLVSSSVAETAQSRISIIVPEEKLEKAISASLEKVEYGLTNDVSDSILSRIVHGKYVPLNDFIDIEEEDEDFDEEEVEADVEGEKEKDRSMSDLRVR